MRDYSLLFGLAALGLIVGCQQSPAPRRPAATPQVSPPAVVRDEADQLMQRGEYGKAAGKYHEAVALAPDDMALRFSLGTAYSHLGRSAEAAEQFQWVVKRGDPAEEYYRAARGWLVNAGMVPGGRPASGGVDASLEGQSQQPTKGKVAGPLEWPGVNPHERLIRVRVTLTGEDDAIKSVNLSHPFPLGEGYEFRDLAPGSYHLVATAEDGDATVELWDQHVSVEAGQMTHLPLSAANSKVTADKFPGSVSR